VKNILIITAHLDDMEIGMGGTVAKLKQQGHKIRLLTFCKGNRPGHEHVAGSRQVAAKKNCNILNIDDFIRLDYSDVSLDTVPFADIRSHIDSEIRSYKPEVIYSHYQYDIHRDHRIVYEAVRVTTRPRYNSSIKELLCFSIPGSTEWGKSLEEFTTFNDITSVHNIKLRCIKNYDTELRESPDPISIDMIAHRDSYIGSLCGYDKAECFKPIFTIS